MNETATLTACDNDTLIQQIGKMNILAISGGRVERRETGITLPVSNGYRVEVDYTVLDEYEVRRVFVRSGERRVKRTWTRVDCFEVGETAYLASCFRSHP